MEPSDFNDIWRWELAREPKLSDEIVEEADPEVKGIKRMLVAVVERAVLDAKYAESRFERARACEWFFETIGDKTEPFSFAWICEHLDRDPVELRHVIVEMIESEERLYHNNFRYRSWDDLLVA